MEHTHGIIFQFSSLAGHRASIPRAWAENPCYRSAKPRRQLVQLGCPSQFPKMRQPHKTPIKPSLPAKNRPKASHKKTSVPSQFPNLRSTGSPFHPPRAGIVLSASDRYLLPMGPAAKYKGMVVYNFAYDVAYEMRDEMPRTLLGSELSLVSIDSSRRNPKHMAFYRPLTARLSPTERIGPHGPVRVERSVKILPMGAISISIRVPFSVESLHALVSYHDLEFSNGNLHDEVRQLAEEISLELRPYMVQPARAISEEEAYTVFCIESPSLGSDNKTFQAEKWLIENRRAVASILTQETDEGELSDQEAIESTSRFLSYYETDLMVIDWDAALVIDEPSDFHEPLYIMELANLQLAELEAYDRMLDAALERSYRDLRVSHFFKRREIMARLREIRIDLTRFNDEISNITKFFGDWYFAKIYEQLSARFHLADWHRSIEVKLKTLDQLYQFLNADQSNRWMLILELAIVLLFIIDLIVIFFVK